jgi:hypothetical protein
MNWYKKIASSGCGDCKRIITSAWNHCLDRLDDRLAPYAAELRHSVDAAEDLYGRFRQSVAVCVKELPKMMAMNKSNDTSNGDWAVVILRPRGMKSECKTMMLRRSPNGISPQPFTPYALRVDKVVTYNEFLGDIQKMFAEPSTPKQPKPSLITTDSVKSPVGLPQTV